MGATAIRLAVPSFWPWPIPQNGAWESTFRAFEPTCVPAAPAHPLLLRFLTAILRDLHTHLPREQFRVATLSKLKYAAHSRARSKPTRAHDAVVRTHSHRKRLGIKRLQSMLPVKVPYCFWVAFTVDVAVNARCTVWVVLDSFAGEVCGGVDMRSMWWCWVGLWARFVAVFCGRVLGWPSL